jgi:hypothetical protein
VVELRLNRRNSTNGYIVSKVGILKGVMVYQNSPTSGYSLIPSGIVDIITTMAVNHVAGTISPEDVVPGFVICRCFSTCCAISRDEMPPVVEYVGLNDGGGPAIVNPIAESRLLTMVDVVVVDV